MKFLKFFIVCALVLGSAVYFSSRTANIEKTEYSQDDDRLTYEQLVTATEPYMDKLFVDRGPAADNRSSTKLKSGEVFPALTENQLMIELESRGFRLESILNQAKIKWNTLEFSQNSSLYADFVQLSKQDIAASIEEENKYRVSDWGLVGSSVTNKRKNFDPKWLYSIDSSYELVGVVNRMDRIVFSPTTCGELRLLYRLTYKKEKIKSRLPLTINLVFYLPNDNKNCTTYISEWTAPTSENLDFVKLADWIVKKGPLQSKNVNLKNVKALETNYQVIRSSSGVRNLLGGTGEYVLRVFHFENQRLVRGGLENTIDPDILNKNANLKNNLLMFLKNPVNFKKIENGTLKIPEQFLALKISSFSPHGIARYDNRPFDKVYKESDFQDLSYSGNNHVRTPNAVLRRLNDLSCVGCHQNRTIAGFHFLGEDRAQTHPLNSIFSAGSGHFQSEMIRRMKYLEAVRKNEVPPEDRPFSIAPMATFAKYGDFCGLPGSRGFVHWVCEDDLVCANEEGAIGEKDLGKCVFKKRLSGDACIKNFLIQNHHSLDKPPLPTEIMGCNNGDPKYSCQPPGGGFPSGMCTSSCDNIKDKNREICGPIAGNGFSDCLSGKVKTFDQCLENHKELRSRGRCDENNSCRNDYVCMKVSPTEGACVPSYFLFQIRVDGHPVPK